MFEEKPLQAKLKLKLKALGDALKFPQSTRGKEERATVTPEKKQLEWQNSELLKLEVAASERHERQRFREEEMALQAKRKAEDEEKAEEERKRKKRRDGLQRKGLIRLGKFRALRKIWEKVPYAMCNCLFNFTILVWQ